VLGHGVHRRTRCAPAALRSDNCGESVHEACVSFGTHATPRPARPRRIQKGTQLTAIRAIALLGPISRAQAPRAAQAGPSAAMARVAIRLLDVRMPNPLLAAPTSGRLRGEHGRRSAHASLTDSPWLSERRAPAQSEFHGAPRNRPDAGCPVAQRRGRRLGGAFLLGTFLWRSKEQVPRPPGRVPASVFNPSMLFTPARQGFDPSTSSGQASSARTLWGKPRSYKNNSG
jgi:hypothetical protein